ncbi:hypothetical protein JFN88_09475 [Paenibacillus sp. MAHUQ-46]|uniref:Uncharacterized protein n=2 Tax=Paenibacillus TaxID=44249 RepID=A0A934J2D0_9BACL|nr:hypothetical protein [Paenibacillus roseus]
MLWAALAGQYVLGFIAAFALLRVFVTRRPRWLHLSSGRSGQQARVPESLLRWLGLGRDSKAFKEREGLLAGIGYVGDPAFYLLFRQLLLVLLPAAAAVGYKLGLQPLWYAGAFASAALLMFDKPWLQSMKGWRTGRMTKEIYTISNQLLYLSGSSLNIHTKLMRCLPYARVLRSDLQRLLGEWYHDAEGALTRFKLRIGTEEGLSFVETINSLRLHESGEYYRLLRERIQDYKEKLDLAKESRKESASYLLFVLAGVPILYMFQIFIYPWVQETQKLFQSLN